MVGDSYGQEFDNFIEAKLSTERVDSADEAFRKVQNGEADYFVYALYSGEKAIMEKNMSNAIKIIPKYVANENFYITVSKKSDLSRLMPQINEMIEKYKNDGTVDALIEKNKEASRRIDECFEKTKEIYCTK
jgi:polar amino acid transport system substrate-binding protein